MFNNLLIYLFLTASPEVQCGPCFTRGLFIFQTARPGAECDSCFTRVHFICFFFVCFVTRRRPPLGQLLVGTLSNKTCSIFFAQKLLKYKKMLYILFSLLSVKFIFFSFYRSVRFEAKKVSERARITSRNNHRTNEGDMGICGVAVLMLFTAVMR